MRLISRNEMKKILFNTKGSKAITIATKTKPSLTGGKSCPFKNVEKIALTNVMINFDYQKSVNNQRKREGITETFVASERKWGDTLFTYNERSGGRRHIPFVAKNVDSEVVSEEEFMDIPDSDLFLLVKIQSPLGYEYYLNNVLQDKNEVNKYVRSSSNTQKQGVEKEVMPRTYSWSNVTEIVMDGETYKIAG